MEKKIYLVGGAVRDMLLSVPSSDKDFVAVGYTPDDFKGYPCVGKDFPVYLLPDGNELALARRENKIALGYNGFSVETSDVSLEEDLARRDLTINAIAYDEKENIFIDPFHGQDDIKNKILRHTTDAFSEDPLRVLRLARFYTKLGSDWQIATETLTLIATMKNELYTLKKERVYKEIEKVIEYPNWFDFFIILKQLDVLPIVFPNVYQLFINENKKFVETKSRLLKNRVTKFTLLYYFVLNNTDNFDMELAKKEKQKVVLLIQSLHNIQKFASLSDDEKIDFFLGFKKEKELFDIFLSLWDIFGVNENKDVFKKMLNQIIDYSPKSWIDLCESSPTVNDIKNHLHEHYLQTITLLNQ